MVGIAMVLYALIYLQKAEMPTSPQLPASLSQPVNVVVRVENWERSSPREIKDSNGYTAAIETVVLSNDFSWAFESDKNVQRNGEDANINEHLLSPGISGVIAKYSDVIAVGAASSEGVEQNPIEEAERAARRADQLQLWIKNNIIASNPLYSLSLGYYQGTIGKVDSAEQRKIVVIGVIRKDEAIDLADALRRSLHQVETFPFLLEDYSEFKLTRKR